MPYLSAPSQPSTASRATPAPSSLDGTEQHGAGGDSLVAAGGSGSVPRKSHGSLMAPKPGMRVQTFILVCCQPYHMDVHAGSDHSS
jgi:hypothetical protein